MDDKLVPLMVLLSVVLVAGAVWVGTSLLRPHVALSDPHPFVPTLWLRLGAAMGEAMPGSGRSGVVGGWLTHPSSHLRQALVAPNGVLHESC